MANGLSAVRNAMLYMLFSLVSYGNTA